MMLCYYNFKGWDLVGKWGTTIGVAVEPLSGTSLWSDEEEIYPKQFRNPKQKLYKGDI